MLSWRGPDHPNAGGAELVMHEHSKAWIKGGHTVTLFTSSFVGAKKNEIKNKVKIIRSGRQFFDVQLRAAIWYLFRKHGKFDLVIDEFHGIPFFTPIYTRGKTIAFIHEVAKEVWKLNPWPKPAGYVPACIGPFIEKLIFKIFYKKTPFITVSESTKKDLLSMGVHSKNIEVIKNGVNLLKVGSQKKEIAPTVIFLGAISEDKGIYDAIKAFNEIYKKDDMFQFWVVGRGGHDELKKTKKLAKKLKILPKINFFGYVTEKKKFELLAKSHVMINPSYHEGWGLVNIESNSVGTPVVGYNVHGTRDSVKHNKTGVLVKKGDYKNLAKSIIDLVRDKKKYEKMAVECKDWTKTFNWKDSTKKSLSLIESL